MPMRMCLNCIYLCWDPRRWLRSLAMDEPLVPMCANHPQWPGQLREVPGTACRNYKPKPPEPDESDDTVRRIPLSDGQFALVDAADYEWLSRHTWTLNGYGYAVRREKGKVIFMHRQILQPPKGMFVDHIDGSRTNNRRANLRPCTRDENMRNQVKRVGASSQFKGVSLFKKTGKWCAKIYFLGEHVWLGCFIDEMDAARAYDHKAVALFGAFARLNFPREWPAEQREKVYAEAQPLRDALRAKAAKAKAKKKRSKKAKGKRTPTRAGTRGRRERTRAKPGPQRVTKKPPRKKSKEPVGLRRAKKN